MFPTYARAAMPGASMRRWKSWVLAGKHRTAAVLMVNMTAAVTRTSRIDGDLAWIVLMTF